jgi:hypothetical protein
VHNLLNQPSSRVTFCYRKRRKGRLCKKGTLAFNLPFLPHSPFGRRENTSTKKVALIPPKLQKTPNPGLQVSF